MLKFESVGTTLGPLTAIESERGLWAVEFGRFGARALSERFPGREFTKAVGLKSARQLKEFCAGDRQDFDLKIDWSLVDGFRRDTLKALRRVRFGKLVSYGELARRLGKPGAARAVGGAMATNPLPIVVPCHRVIAQDGSLGGFSGGLPLKRKLHRLEGIEPLRGGWWARRAP